MNKKAFTLIELLVTIVIVGLLLAILFPVLGKAREGARRAQCANNLRQHGIAWYLYLDDHNECFPKMSYGSTGDVQCNNTSFGGKAGAAPSDAYTANMRPLNRYLDVDNTSSAEIFHCPDDAKPSYEYGTFFNGRGNSYYFNQGVHFFVVPGIFDYSRRPLSTITSPRSKVYLEICGGSPGHERGSMVLFVDGHVKGPYLWYGSEFDMTPTGLEPEKPIYFYPNTTPDLYD